MMHKSLNPSRLSLFSLLFCLLLSLPLLQGCKTFNQFLSGANASRLDAAAGRGVRPLPLHALRRVLWLRGRVQLHPNPALSPLSWKLGAQEGATPLIVDQTTLYIGSTEQKFTRFDLERSLRLKPRWEVKVQGRVVSKAVANDDHVYFGTTRGVFYALEVETGKVLWTYRVGGEILADPVLVSNEDDDKKPPLVLFSTSNNKVYALHSEKGKMVWQYKRDPAASLTIRGQAPPVVHKGRVYTGFSDGVVASLNLYTGEEVWTRNISERTRFVDVDMAPVIGDGVLYTSSYSGSLHALSLKDGKTQWKKRIVGAGKALLLKGRSYSTLYVTNVDGSLFALNPYTGRERWKKKFQRSGGLGAPVGNQKYLVVASRRYGLYILRRSNGSLVQIMRTGGGFHAPLMLDGTMLYALSNGRFLYSFSTEKGRVQRENR